jgi:hypothetical protein
MRLRAVRDGLVVAGLLLTAAQLAFAFIGYNDAGFYWATGHQPLADLYGQYSVSGHGFGYSPVFAQAISPLTLLPWPVFRVAWLLIGLGALIWLARPVPSTWRLPFFLLCLPEVVNGNVHLLIAAAIALAAAYPAAWAFVALTKVTPSVAVLWHVARREWRPVAVAAIATTLLVAISYAWDPAPWGGWIQVLWTNRAAGGVTIAPQIPLVARLPVAALLVVWGGWTGRRWTIAAAATLALPHIVLTGFTVLAAIPRLEEADRRVDAGEPLVVLRP